MLTMIGRKGNNPQWHKVCYCLRVAAKKKRKKSGVMGLERIPIVEL